MVLRYREMTAADLPAAFAVRLSTVENAITMAELEAVYGITPESLAEAMQTTVRGWLCEVSGTAVGFAMGDRSNGEVQVVAVRPEYEGKGIGKALLAQVQDWLFAEGHDEIWLLTYTDEPPTRAYCFYQALGWHPTGKMVGDDEVFVLRKRAEKGTVPLP